MKGCRFSSPDQASLDLHKKIQHFEFQHKGGCSNNLLNSNNPDDIEKWRAQRRARYPKLANIVNTEKPIESIECSQGQKNAFRRELQRSSSSNRHNNRHNNNNYNNSNGNHFKNHKRSHYQNNQHESNNNPKRSKLVEEERSSSKLNLEPNNKCDETRVKSFQLLSNYDSEDSDDCPLEVTTKKLTSDEVQRTPYEVPKPAENVERIVRECMNSLLNKVDNKLKRESKVPQKRHPHQPKLYYDKLTLFQKLMLQDVRTNKTNLIECLKMLTADLKSFL